jgi:hypothetical protein
MFTEVVQIVLGIIIFKMRINSDENGKCFQDVLRAVYVEPRNYYFFRIQLK